MIKYLLEVGGPKPTTNDACMNASHNAEMLQYLHENGFNWEGTFTPLARYYYDEDENDSRMTIAHKVIENGNLQGLKYIISKGYKPDTSDVSLCNMAAANNDPETFQFLISLGCKAFFINSHITNTTQALMIKVL